MVEATRVNPREEPYAVWRTDKEPTPGYTRELVSTEVDTKYYDDLASQPVQRPGLQTFLQTFELNVAESPNAPFLGRRIKLPDGTMTPDYVWKTVSEVNKEVKDLAKGLMEGEFCPEVDGEVEGQKLRFCGVMAKNRMEWTQTLLACMHYKIIIVGFFTAMGVDQIEFILNQTEMSTLVVEPDFVAKIVGMKKDGQAAHIKNLVIMDDKAPENAEECAEVGLKITLFPAVQEAGGKAKDAPEFTYPGPHDPYMFCYTSGTTGDSKGVKLTH